MTQIQSRLGPVDLLALFAIVSAFAYFQMLIAHTSWGRPAKVVATIANLLLWIAAAGAILL